MQANGRVSGSHNRKSFSTNQVRAILLILIRILDNCNMLVASRELDFYTKFLKRFFLMNLLHDTCINNAPEA